MQSPPFGIIGINNSNSCHTGNPPPKTAAADTGATRQLPPIPVMNPSARVGQHGEGGEGSTGNKSAARSTKKRAPYMGDGAHASLDSNETLPV